MKKIKKEALAERLLSSVGGIDDKYLQEAMEFEPAAAAPKWKKASRILVAAALLLAILPAALFGIGRWMQGEAPFAEQPPFGTNTPVGQPSAPSYGLQPDGGNNGAQGGPIIGVPDDGVNPEYAGTTVTPLLPDSADTPATNPDSDPDPIHESSFFPTNLFPAFTFSADVDTAGYGLFRKLTSEGVSFHGLRQNGVYFRHEDFLNYFRYSGKAPEAGELFGLSAAVLPCPWNTKTQLLRLTLQAEEVVPASGNNLVFLIDVSGSMNTADRLPLLQQAFGILVDQLTAADRVTIITYAGEAKTVISGCPGDRKTYLMEAIQGLEAGGGTNGESGIQMAYAAAEEHFLEGGNNRIILASDGDLNIGISSPAELQALVEEKRNSGVYLSVLGFGTSGFSDANMEALAHHGNGVYYYIDGIGEAEKVFGTDLLATLYTVAKDTKLQITFDPRYISSYRIIGYDNRILSNEDYENDQKDAGDIGTGHQVTVFYEIVLTPEAATASDAWATLGVRYKRAGEETSVEDTYRIDASHRLADPAADPDFAFQSALLKTTMLLRNSRYLGDITLQSVIQELSAQSLSGSRAEFYNLLLQLRENSAQPQKARG